MAKSDLAKAVESIYGPSIVGCYLACLLWGLSIAQVYIYFKSPPQGNRPWLTALVFLLLMIDSAVSALDFKFLYENLILKFGSTEVVQYLGWAFALNRGLTGTIGTMVQLFFSWRILKLTGNRLMTFIVVAMALVGYGSCLGLAAILWRVDVSHYDQFKIEAYVWLLPTMFCDMIITAVLVFHLRNHKSGFTATDHFIDAIIRLSVQTGALTSVFALMDLVMYVAVGKKNGAHITFQIMLSKAYINSFMSSLNARQFALSTADKEELQSGRRTRRPGEVFTLSNVQRPEIMITVDHHNHNEFEQDMKGLRSHEAVEVER